MAGRASPQHECGEPVTQDRCDLLAGPPRRFLGEEQIDDRLDDEGVDNAPSPVSLVDQPQETPQTIGFAATQLSPSVAQDWTWVSERQERFAGNVRPPLAVASGDQGSNDAWIRPSRPCTGLAGVSGSLRIAWQASRAAPRAHLGAPAASSAPVTSPVSNRTLATA